MIDCKFPIRQLLRHPGFTFLVVLMSCGSPAPGAETGFVRPLSLKDCIQIALEHNLDVKIERFTPEMAEHDLSLAKAAFEPIAHGSAIHQSGSERAAKSSANAAATTTTKDSFQAGITGVLPTGLTYQAGGDASSTWTTGAAGQDAGSQGSVSIQLRQPLLKNFWIDGARLNILVSRKLLGIAELGFRQQIMDTVTNVELAYYDLKLAQQNLRVQEDALSLARELLTANRHRVREGVLAPLDEKQAESRVASQRGSLLVAGRLLAAQRNVLKGLLSDNMSVWKDLIIEPTDEMTAWQVALNRQASWRKGLTQRPDILQSRLGLEQLGYVLKYNRNQLYPQLDLVGSYGFGGAGREFADIGKDQRPSYSIGVVVTIPLGNAAARSNYQISKAGQRHALVKLQQLEQNIMLQIEDTVVLARTNFGRVGATREARGFAESALQAEQIKFENGRSTSFFVLQFQRDLTAARSAEIQALADYHKALAQLALHEGSVLERNNLNLKPR